MNNEEKIIELLTEIIEQLKTANQHLDKIENQTLGY